MLHAALTRAAWHGFTAVLVVNSTYVNFALAMLLHHAVLVSTASNTSAQSEDTVVRDCRGFPGCIKFPALIET